MTGGACKTINQFMSCYLGHTWCIGIKLSGMDIQGDIFDDILESQSMVSCYTVKLKNPQNKRDI